MIKAHPTEALLKSYVSGDLNSATALVVATHIDMCPHCQRIAHEIEHELTEAMFTDTESVVNDDFENMLDAIFSTSTPTEYELSQSITTPEDNFISLEGNRFILPRSLARQRDRIGPWSKMLGNIWRASVNLGTDEWASLIYMESGSSVPEHSHVGTELQLVLHGSFTDEYGQYFNGDLVLLDATHQHTPATQNEDCLILAVLDAPLHFTSGISRLLNPFSSLFFR